MDGYIRQLRDTYRQLTIANSRSNTSLRTQTSSYNLTKQWTASAEERGDISRQRREERGRESVGTHSLEASRETFQNSLLQSECIANV